MKRSLIALLKGNQAADDGSKLDLMRCQQVFLAATGRLMLLMGFGQVRAITSHLLINRRRRRRRKKKKKKRKKKRKRRALFY